MGLFGFFNVNKSSGMTSRDVVNVVQRRLRPTKVGHAGTLDPLAEGVLVIAAGPAVRLVPYVQQMPKHYRTVFRLGSLSPTGDLEETPQSMPELPIPSLSQLKSAAAGMIGDIEQTPPAYSAVWVDGKRAYERARGGEDVTIPSRTVRVYGFEILRYAFPTLEARIVCGSGTYIRSLGIDLAARCQTVAVMTKLVRTRIGSFSIKDATSVDDLRRAELTSMLTPASQGVEHLARLRVTAEQKKRLGHGQCLPGEWEPTRDHSPVDAEDSAPSDVAVFDAAGGLCALVRRKRDQWCPHRVFFRA